MKPGLRTPQANRQLSSTPDPSAEPSITRTARRSKVRGWASRGASSAPASLPATGVRWIPSK